MKNILLLLSALFFISALSFGLTAEQKGLQIMKKADKTNEGYQDHESLASMILKNKHGEQSLREMTVKSLEDNNDADRTMVIFHKPKDVKDTALLTYAHKNEDDDQWIYLPSIKRVKRISSSNKTGSFVGSEFSYEDMVPMVIEKYNYKYLKTEKCNKSQKCYVIQQTPKDKQSGYSKRVTWLDTQYYRAMKVQFYDRKEQLVKIMALSQYELYLKKFWRSHYILMKNLQTGKSTELKFGEFSLKKGLNKRDFDKSALKRNR